MKNLENYSVQELNAVEVVSIDGGLFIGVFRTIGRIIAALDRLERFGEGWASVDCECE